MTSSWMGSRTALPAWYFLHDLVMDGTSHNGSQHWTQAKSQIQVGKCWSCIFFILFLFFTTSTENTCYCCCSVTQSCSTLCNPMDRSTLGLPVPHHLPKFAQVYVHHISDAIQPSDLLVPSSSLPSIFPSIRDFTNELALDIRWPNDWSSASTPVLPTSV